MNDTVFTMKSTPYKFGVGVTQEIGYDLAGMRLKRALVVTDPGVARTGLPERVIGLVRERGIETGLFEDVSIEPTDVSALRAIEFARDFRPDGYLAIGGGSVMDTTKIMNLYVTHPAPFLAYVNAPIGEARPIPGPLKPMVCLPTTAGTSSENTAIAVVDMTELHVKTGISHHYLRASLGVLDPLNSLSTPQMVSACSGADVLTHAIESYTALGYDEREKPATPADRPPYQGANPISDIWCERAIRLVDEFLPKVVKDGADLEARTQMMLATIYAGMGFSNAGVHIPHAMGYPIAGNVREFCPPGYPRRKPLVPHGMSTALCAPASFLFTANAKPQRHRAIAEWMGIKTQASGGDAGGRALGEAFIGFMQRIGMPNGLAGVGYGASDIPALTEGALKQKRLLALSPEPVTRQAVERILEESMAIW
ncbi:MAG TPA: hydroxyacid-oxoacid transhydrogenase [Terriglobia bacterium]|nr:hydroxyacid-oxoacid transhydrogenase [Terriglobia bacterium]